jgi:hypothetical protein
MVQFTLQQSLELPPWIEQIIPPDYTSRLYLQLIEEKWHRNHVSYDISLIFGMHLSMTALQRCELFCEVNTFSERLLASPCAVVTSPPSVSCLQARRCPLS